MSVEESLRKRRSVRAFGTGSLSLQDLSQLLWAAQGVTDPLGLRSAPSAGALYPLTLFLVAGDVARLPAGLYRYTPSSHALEPVQTGDLRGGMVDAALHQDWMRGVPITLVVTAHYSRTTSKYGDRGVRYVHIESGHVAQNVYLQATALNLGTTIVGAFRDEQLKAALGLPNDAHPICLLPIGRPAEASR